MITVQLQNVRPENSPFHFHSNNPNKSCFPPFQQQSRRTKAKQESKRQKHKLKGEIKQTNLELDGGRQEQMQSNNSQKKLVVMAVDTCSTAMA
jgi:hypothetical protein